MGKIFWLSSAIIIYPVLRLRYWKIFNDIKISSRNTVFSLTRFIQKLGAIKFERPLKRSKQAKGFEMLFIRLFHPIKGEFRDRELRGRAYDLLIDSVMKGTNYKSLYRRTAATLHPDSAVNSRLMRGELEILFKYFQNNFTHPDKT